MDIATKCQAVASLRAWVKEVCHLESREGGNLWLPLVLTARGPLYGEVIIQREDGTYEQPYPLPDPIKQPLFRLGWQLIRHLEATPAVYLVQFGLAEGVIYFDRVIPYPSEPAVASKGVQEPDLFTCHWLCLQREPLFDLVIKKP
ncbi:MAG: hypothetical protein RMK91_07810 [Pseudanabaenaceae cyanobacterium SKYGB_i_bin29]|nr:hypothetical protein [Pseudanabaenaceae cyanobacterium SKYG29]MDW8421758.1 hypothetical protein [Pseudanabaenaceae cyanobacterium SKYGB_i_bin29]